MIFWKTSLLKHDRTFLKLEKLKIENINDVNLFKFFFAIVEQTFVLFVLKVKRNLY